MNKEIDIIVITGGPKGGKSTVIGALKEEFGGKIVVAPEVSTMLLQGEFPRPEQGVSWSAQWQKNFQQAIFDLQKSLENVCQLIAEQKNARVVICDRGLLDGAAYFPGGLKEFSDVFKIDIEKELEKYAAVIHLESHAVTDPERFGKEGNPHRLENSYEEALKLEEATKKVWQDHPRRIVIGNEKGISGKISEVIGIVKKVLDEGK